MKKSIEGKLTLVLIVIGIGIISVITDKAVNGEFGYIKDYKHSYLDSSYFHKPYEYMAARAKPREIGRMIILKGAVMYKYNEVKDKSVKNAYVLNLGEEDSSLFIVEIKDDTELDVGSSYEVKGFVAAKAKTKPVDRQEYTVPIIDSKIIEPICDEEVKNESDINKKAKCKKLLGKYNNNREIIISIDKLECYNEYSLLNICVSNSEGKKIQILDVHFSISSSANGETLEEKDVCMLKDQLIGEAAVQRNRFVWEH